MSSQTVVITGCSDGGLGAALAIAFNDAGYKVYATARKVAKMSSLTSRGIEGLELDVTSAKSIAALVERLGKSPDFKLDMLVNNAGGGYYMPVLDIDPAELRRHFDLNVYSPIAVSKGFLPLLQRSTNPIIVNNTSLVASFGLPFQGPYNASKAAIAMLTDNLRLELAPFGIQVVDLRTGGVKSNFFGNLVQATPVTLPEGSLYNIAKNEVEKSLRGEMLQDGLMKSATWANQVVSSLSQKKPPLQIWKGAFVFMVWLTTYFPGHWLDGMKKQKTGLDVVERRVKEAESNKTKAKIT